MLTNSKQIFKPLMGNIGISSFTTSAANSDNVTAALTTALATASASGGSVPLQASSVNLTTYSLSEGLAPSPDNLVLIFESGTAKNKVLDSSGEEVYGKLTNAGAVWTLSYFSAPGGVEAAYTFTGATAIDFEVSYLFSFDNLPTNALVSVNARHISPDAGASTRLQTDTLTPTALNTLPNLSRTPSGVMTNVIVNGQVIHAGATTGISVTGVAVTVNSTNLGYNITTSDVVIAEYAY